MVPLIEEKGGWLGEHSFGGEFRVLEDFKDLMPSKLPKELPPRHPTVHRIELQLDSTPLA